MNPEIYPWQEKLSPIFDSATDGIEKIKQSDLQFRILFEAMTEGVALIDSGEQVVRANSAEARILGLDSADARIGQPFRCPSCHYYKSDGSTLTLEELAPRLAFKKKRPTSNREVKIVRANGSAIWCNIYAVPIVNGFGRVTGAVQTLTDITEQKMLREEREQYLANITRVQEEERKRLSRELHDGTAQSLSLLVLEMDAICQMEKGKHKANLKQLEKLRDTAENTLYEVSRYSHELRPTILDHMGLVAAVESLVDDLSQEQRIKINFNVIGNVVRMNDELELALFRISQEALTNVRKHSRATSARVKLRFTARKVRLSISDNGRGFDVNQIQSLAITGHLGLIGMKERANLIKGSLQIKSEIGVGTEIAVEAPIMQSR